MSSTTAFLISQKRVFGIFIRNLTLLELTVTDLKMCVLGMCFCLVLVFLVCAALVHTKMVACPVFWAARVQFPGSARAFPH